MYTRSCKPARASFPRSAARVSLDPQPEPQRQPEPATAPATGNRDRSRNRISARQTAARRPDRTQPSLPCRRASGASTESSGFPARADSLRRGPVCHGRLPEGACQFRRTRTRGTACRSNPAQPATLAGLPATINPDSARADSRLGARQQREPAPQRPLRPVPVCHGRLSAAAGPSGESPGGPSRHCAGFRACGIPASVATGPTPSPRSTPGTSSGLRGCRSVARRG